MTTSIKSYIENKIIILKQLLYKHVIKEFLIKPINYQCIIYLIINVFKKQN